jgi:hypothetical protein
VHGDYRVVLAHRTTPYSPQLLHVPSYTQQQTEMDAKSPDIRPCLARDPKDSEVTVIVKFDELRLVDCPDTKLAFDGRNERRALEQSSGEGVEGTVEGFGVGELVMQPEDANVFLAWSGRISQLQTGNNGNAAERTSALLAFYEPRGSVNADGQAARYFWVESSGVASFFTAQYTANPCDDFVRRWVGWFVQVDNTRPRDYGIRQAHKLVRRKSHT